MKATKRLSIPLSCLFALIVSQLALAQLPSGSDASGPTTQPTSQAAASVRIENFAFIPRELDIAVGATVTWRNADDVPHTATSKDQPQTFDSGPLDTDDKFSFTFNKPGSYPYYCKVHPHMTGLIVVK